jgi:hypothetical protein
MQKNTRHLATPNFQLKKKEKRKKEKEGRKLRPTVERSRPDPRQCRADSRPAWIWLATETLDLVSPAFFFGFSLVFPSGGFSFFLVFRMIKSPKGLTFPSRF